MERILEIVRRILLRDKDVLLLPFLAITMGVTVGSIVLDKKSAVVNEKDLVLALAMTFLFVVVLMTRYLTVSTTRRPLERLTREGELFSHLVKEVHDLRKQRDLISEDDRTMLIEGLKQKVHDEAADQVIKTIEQKVQQAEFRQRIVERAKNTLSRIYSEIDSLGRRGTINLVLGVATALAGVGALSMFVLFDTKEHQGIESFTIAFLPRLSIVLIIEVFSYFFLRLYKASLSEIKYFQNEATNIEFNFVGLETALHLADKDLTKRALGRFIEIERNPILTKSQTTREIASEELASKGTRFTADHLAEIVKALGRDKPRQKGEADG